MPAPCPSTTNYLNQALLWRMAVSDMVLKTGNGQQALELVHAHYAHLLIPEAA
ncbi:hypothetical protein [Hymenobacter sp. UYP22]|uniref:hypothetical protein n=1 Tax=Hymenobacter sp. UYP22 TaxID=3156348 RepID=UPI00339A18A1